jgi:hypothetical protein
MASTIESLFAAIKTRYDSSNGAAIRTAGATGLYYGRAPQEATHPFIVVNVAAGETQNTIGHGSDSAGAYDDMVVDVNAFDDTRSPARGMAIQGAWFTAFNFADLDLSGDGFLLVHGYRSQAPISIEEPAQKGWNVTSGWVYNVGN